MEAGVTLQRSQLSRSIIYGITFSVLGLIAASPLVLGASAIALVKAIEAGRLFAQDARMVAIVFLVPLSCYALAGIFLGALFSLFRLNARIKQIMGAVLSATAGIASLVGLNALLPSSSVMGSGSDAPGAAFGAGIAFLLVTGLIAMMGGAAAISLIEDWTHPSR